MTREELDAIRARLEAATPGPWYTVGSPWLRGGVPTYVVAGTPDPHGAIPVAEPIEEEDADEDDELGRCDANMDFIANAPTDIRALLEEMERLREALGQIANGEAYYGEPSSEYKSIARQALYMEGPDDHL